MKRVLKWIGYLVAGIVVIIGLGVGTVYGITSARMSKSYSTNVPTVAIPNDPPSIAHGKHLVEAVGKCQVCHGDNYGGTMVMDDPMFARLSSANLTSGKGGIAATYTDQDWVRTLRYGVGRDGKSLRFMPAEAYTHLNDADLGEMIAYLKTLPPADATVPRVRSIGPIARMVSLVSEFPLIPARLIPADMKRPVIAEGPTPEYGRYLVESGGCTGCHTSNLGGNSSGNMTTPNLTRSGELSHWTEADFAKVLRTGVRPDGRTLSTTMPWQYTRGLTDTEISAMWSYLQMVPLAPTKK
jgi:mono/diheme cytochrome c family protein